MSGWNWTNLSAVRWIDQPVRVALHPHDLELRLAGALRRVLNACRRAMRYEDVFAGPDASPVALREGQGSFSAHT